ncbi:MAG: D-ribose ABC transporter substrate-binding protein [Rhodoluna sp.]
MLRKVLSIAGASVLAVSLAACAPAADTDATTDATTGGGLIAIITVDQANPFWAAEAETAKAEAEALGYTTTVADHKNDPTAQDQLIDTAIASGAVAIILDPAGADESIGAVQKATDAGIPVLLVNAEINQTGIAKAQIVSNNAQGAALGAEEFAKAMNFTGDYVELFGNPTDNNAGVRSEGYKSVLSQYPDMANVGMEVANWDRTQGKDKMDSLLQAYPNLTGIIAGNDEMALGAIAALEAAGRTDVIVGGFDGNSDAAAAVTSGKMAYTVLQPIANLAMMAVEQAHSYLTTGSTGVADEKQTVDCVLINPDNVSKYTSWALEG